MPDSRYAASLNKQPRKPRLAATTRKRRGFLMIEGSEIPAWGRCYGSHVALHLEMIRLSGLQWVRRRDGWVALTAATLQTIGLGNRYTRHSAVRRAVELGWLETRSGGVGHKLEYRLRSEWAKPSAEIIKMESRARSDIELSR